MNRSLAFTRDPLDRFVSGVRYCISKGWLERAHPVDRALDLVERGDMSGCDNDRASTEHLLPHTHPSYFLDRVAHVGRFENLQNDFDKICTLLDIGQWTLPHINKSRRRRLSLSKDHLDRFLELFQEAYHTLSYIRPSPTAHS